MTQIARKTQTIEVDLHDWRTDVPQEGSRTLVLASSRALIPCVFINEYHRTILKSSNLQQHQVLCWIYSDDLAKQMTDAMR